MLNPCWISAIDQFYLGMLMAVAYCGYFWSHLEKHRESWSEPLLSSARTKDSIQSASCVGWESELHRLVPWQGLSVLTPFYRFSRPSCWDNYQFLRLWRLWRLWFQHFLRRGLPCLTWRRVAECPRERRGSRPCILSFYHQDSCF